MAPIEIESCGACSRTDAGNSIAWRNISKACAKRRCQRHQKCCIPRAAARHLRECAVGQILRGESAPILSVNANGSCQANTPVSLQSVASKSRQAKNWYCAFPTCLADGDICSTSGGLSATAVENAEDAVKAAAIAMVRKSVMASLRSRRLLVTTWSPRERDQKTSQTKNE